MKTYKQNCFYRHRWQCLIFLSEFIYMGLEMDASRIMSPKFGTTLDIWSSIIGIILASSAIGNWLAGRIGDNQQSRHTWIVRCLLICAIWLACIPALFSFLINIGVTNLPHIISALITCIVLFMLPGVCIGMLSPLILTQYANEQKLEIGHASSKFYTAMTLGGLAGTFAAGFLLVPTFGSINLIFIMSTVMGLLGLLSIVMLKRIKENESIFLAITFFVVLINMVNASIFSKQNTELNVWTDTFYGRAHVVDSVDGERPIRSLMVSGGYESAMYLDDKSKSELVFDYLKSSSKITKNLLKEDDHALCLGGGAYSFPKYLALKQKAKVDVVEIDKGVTTLAHKYFYLDEVSNNSKHKITNYAGDGRVILPTLKKNEYALVFNDTFAGEEPVATLSTLEATKSVKEVLKPNGFYIMNIIGIFDDASNGFLGWEIKTLRETFKSVRVFYAHDKDSYDGKTQQNWVVVATDNTEWKPPKSLYEVKPNLDGAKILTDDNCPVEYLTARLRLTE